MTEAVDKDVREALLDELEEAAIEYREHMCSETGKRYDAARDAVKARMRE